jgi:hypothetical protein
LLWLIGLGLVSGHLFFRWSFGVMGAFSLVVGLVLIWQTRTRPQSAPVISSSQALNARLMFILAFSVGCLLCNIGSVALLGRVLPRYLMPSLLIPLFFGWPFLLAGSQRLRSYLASPHLMNLCAVGILGLGAALNGHSVVQRLPALAELSDFYPDVVACIDEHTRKYNVKNGLSQYWLARPLTMLSKNDLNVVQVRHGMGYSLIPNHWINNYNWYNQKFEFVITEILPNNPRSIYPQAIVRAFGPPAHRFRCDQRTVLVYNRERDQHFQEQFKDRFFREFSASELPSETGRVAGTSRIAESPHDQPGALTYGPYVGFS